MELPELREQICKKDLEIIKLISERMDLVKQVGEAKKENGLPIVNPEVEKRVISRYVENGAAAGLSSEVMSTVASALIKEAVILESQIKNDCPKRTISIIGGGGKMGGWMKRFMEESGHEVTVIDPMADNGLTIDDCRSSEVVIVSVPLHLTNEILAQLDGICGGDTLIFDLSSLKTPVEGTLKEMASKRKVCSVHPMFGPSAKSMYGQNLLVCDCGNKTAVEETCRLFDDKGGNITKMNVSEHDGYMSYVLGLTHAVNIALFTVLERSGLSFEDAMAVASTTFKKGLDTNRSVASEDPMLYYEIQHMNSHRDEMWALFTKAVCDLKDASVSDDPEKFVELMDAGRNYFGSN